MIGEKGADLVKDLWLQDDNVVRYERDAKKSAASTKAEGTFTKKSINKKTRAAISKKVNVFTNATAA